MIGLINTTNILNIKQENYWYLMGGFLKGTATLKASESVMQAIFKPCNLPQTWSKPNEK